MTTATCSYKITYSRRRSIGIIVTPDNGVIVRAPFRTPVRVIEKFVSAKSDWINKHLESYSAMIRLNHTEVADGKICLFRGKQYILRVSESDKNSVVQGENEILINLKEPGDKTVAAKVLEKWYKHVAAEQITSRVGEMIETFHSFGFLPSAIIVRTMKRRWGSCSSKGKITINSELIKLDCHYLDYVILHELCHLRHHNHSHDFYKLLSEVYPRWKEARKSLRKFIA